MAKKKNLSIPIDDDIDERIVAEVKRTKLSRADVARMGLRAGLPLVRRVRGGLSNATR